MAIKKVQLKIDFKSLGLKKFFENPLFSDKLSLGLIFSNLGLNLVLWLVLALGVRPTSNLIPIHFTITEGVIKLGPWYQIYIFSGLGLFIFLINLGVAALVYSKERIVSLISLLSSIFVQVLILIYEILLILIILG